MKSGADRDICNSSSAGSLGSAAPESKRLQCLFERLAWKPCSRPFQLLECLLCPLYSTNRPSSVGAGCCQSATTVGFAFFLFWLLVLFPGHKHSMTFGFESCLCVNANILSAFCRNFPFTDNWSCGKTKYPGNVISKQYIPMCSKNKPKHFDICMSAGSVWKHSCSNYAQKSATMYSCNSNRKNNLLNRKGWMQRTQHADSGLIVLAVFSLLFFSKYVTLLIFRKSHTNCDLQVFPLNSAKPISRNSRKISSDDEEDGGVKNIF